MPLWHKTYQTCWWLHYKLKQSSKLLQLEKACCPTLWASTQQVLQLPSNNSSQSNPPQKLPFPEVSNDVKSKVHVPPTITDTVHTPSKDNKVINTAYNRPHMPRPQCMQTLEQLPDSGCNQQISKDLVFIVLTRSTVCRGEHPGWGTPSQCPFTQRFKS